MEPERSGSSSQRPLGLSSRVAFWYLRSVLPVSSNGRLSARLPETATSAFDFNERFAGPCRSSVPFFRQWTIRPLALIDPNARSGALVPCPLISIHGVDVPIRALLEKHYRSAFGPEDIANLAAAFEAALSKLGAGRCPRGTSSRHSSSRTAAARLGIRAQYRNSSTAAISSGDSSTCRRSDR